MTYMTRDLEEAGISISDLQHDDDLPSCEFSQNSSTLQDVHTCPRHLSLYSARFGICYEGERRHAVDVGSQAAYLISELGRFNSLFSTICPPHYLPARMACWYIEAALGLDECQPTEEECFSWAVVANYLRARGILIGDDANALELHHYFLFCLTGAMTCLYQPAKPEEARPLQHYPIVSRCPITNHRFWCFFVSSLTVRGARNSVCVLLNGLGEVLPLADREGTTVADTSRINTDYFNAEVMVSVLGIKVAWTDILGAHLDFDSLTNTLFVFRQPTLCYLNSSEFPDRKQTLLNR